MAFHFYHSINFDHNNQNIETEFTTSLL